MITASVFWVCVAGVFYHHVIYPILLRLCAARIGAAAPPPASGDFPSITVIAPAYNEAAFIEAKLADLARLDYPADRLRIRIVCDGCSDDTVARARRWIASHWSSDRDVLVVEHAVNRGKVAVLNEAISSADTDLIVLSDVSAALEPDALLRASAHFADASVGFVTGEYRLAGATAAGEADYWRYQVEVKRSEAMLGSPMGAHGAFYAFRRSSWQALEPDTINDDFVLPMRIVAAGLRGVYDTAIVVTERDNSDARLDFHRRLRIAAGNAQQLTRTPGLADLRRPGLAFAFLSGKAMRVVTPALMAIALLCNVILAGDGAFWHAMLGLHLGGYLLAALGLAMGARAPRALAALGYLVRGHVAGLLGGAAYVLRMRKGAWTRVAALDEDDYIDPLARAGKRVLDIVCALGALIVMAVLFIPIALAIKLDSRGPIFYRQLRVGRATRTSTELFRLTKFRTMRTDAEVSTGAVWAAADDPRITRVGRFLRKSRLDELPQAWNVLLGDMSVVGPRPERPQFFERLEGAIPFYTERTYGLKPGITGLAQVSQGYDCSIEDVRSKVLYDHAYAARISRPVQWFLTDVSIILRTFSVMVLGKGQ